MSLKAAIASSVLASGYGQRAERLAEGMQPSFPALSRLVSHPRPEALLAVRPVSASLSALSLWCSLEIFVFLQTGWALNVIYRRKTASLRDSPRLGEDVVESDHICPVALIGKWLIRFQAGFGKSPNVRRRYQ